MDVSKYGMLFGGIQIKEWFDTWSGFPLRVFYLEAGTAAGSILPKNETLILYNVPGHKRVGFVTTNKWTDLYKNRTRFFLCEYAIFIS